MKIFRFFIALIIIIPFYTVEFLLKSYLGIKFAFYLLMVILCYPAILFVRVDQRSLLRKLGASSFMILTLLLSSPVRRIWNFIIYGRLKF